MFFLYSNKGDGGMKMTGACLHDGEFNVLSEFGKESKRQSIIFKLGQKKICSTYIICFLFQKEHTCQIYT